MPSRSSGYSYVIGGNGFIGRPLVKLLRDSGREVTIISRTPPATREKGVTYQQGDYGDRAFLERVLQRDSEVIHLAYASVPKTSFEDPLRDLQHNISPTLTLFEVASEQGVKKLIIVSSGGTVYGHSQSLPISETHPTNPISPYGITKLAIEKYAGLFWALKNLPITIVRPANGYGPGQIPFTGQGFIATAIASILQQKEIVIFGGVGNVRDYIHVDDIARGILAALETGKLGECYNLGTGVGTNNKKVIDILKPHARQAGLTPRLTHLPARGFDVRSNVLDSSKIRQDTAWQPQITLEEGLKIAWDHYISL